MNEIPRRRRNDTEAETKRLTALVVDDNPSHRDLITILLSRLGFLTCTANDGLDALSCLEGGVTYDVVIIDLNMPRLDGLSLIEKIRTMETMKSAYTIMMTATEDVGTKIEALSRGFDDFIVKGASELEIVATLGAAQRLLMRKQSSDLALTQLYGLAYRDELTGLFNRRYFFAEAERIFEAPAEIKNIVLFDLNEFKSVNDTWGHLTGDRLLADVGSLFLRYTRQEDLVARYGGDEFVMLIFGVGADEAIEIAKRLTARIEELEWNVRDQTIRTAASFGLGSQQWLPQSGLTRLLTVCDENLYKNKAARRRGSETVR